MFLFLLSSEININFAQYELCLYNLDVYSLENTQWEKMWKLESSFPGNVGIWWEILEFGGKLCYYQGKIVTVENSACFPRRHEKTL